MKSLTWKAAISVVYYDYSYRFVYAIFCFVLLGIVIKDNSLYILFLHLPIPLIGWVILEKFQVWERLVKRFVE